MKKASGLLIVLAILFTLAACGNSNGGAGTTNQNASTTNLEDKYPGYYANFDEGIISVTNYDPDDMGSIPSYQEMIAYGDGAGLENEGTVYYIFIVDTVVSTEKNEKCYYAEFADETMEILIEEDTYFANEEERKEIVDKLIEIMNCVRNDSNE